jgi:hypothetical protein
VQFGLVKESELGSEKPLVWHFFSKLQKNPQRQGFMGSFNLKR